MVLYVVVLLFVFFNQKTAYEMRISDWSSDVCSSDLRKAASSVRGQDAPALNVPFTSLPEGAQYLNHGFFNGRASVPTSWVVANGYYNLAHADEIRELYRRSEEHTSELQSLMRNSYDVLCLNKKPTTTHKQHPNSTHH